MKSLLLGIALLFSTSALAAHPASKFVKDTLTQGQQILEQKSADARITGMCTLLNQKLHKGYISSKWLGKYENLSREATAVQTFKGMVPSIMLTAAFGGGSGDTLSGGFSVGQNARARGNNFFGVAVKVSNGKDTYNGTLVVWKGKSGRFYLVDVEYMGFSGVNYMGRDYKRTLDSEYRKDPNNSKPVTTLIRQIKSDSNYINCP